MKMNKKMLVLLLAQLVAVLFCGFFAEDTPYAITVSIIGVLFNLLVSLNIPYGFLFGFAYAITNGILAYQTGAFATCLFMLALQAPMAVYSFFGWKRKKSKSNEIMKLMPAWEIVLLLFGMLFIGILVYFILLKTGGSSVLTDTVFFVFSVAACLLLAGCYKNAYILTLFSGMGGTALWIYQLIHYGNGLSVAAFYVIVTVNSAIAVYHQYFKRKKN